MYNFHMNVELNIKPVNPEEICSKAVYDKETCSGKSVLKFINCFSVLSIACFIQMKL